MRIINHGCLAGILFLLLCISSCSTQSFPAQTDPDTSRFDTGYTSYSDDYTAEQDYSNIIAFTDKQEYPTTFDKINVTIKNENPGKGFYFFSIPVIEYNDKGEWKRLNYSPESYEIPEQWAVVLAVLSDTGEMLTYLGAVDALKTLSKGFEQYGFKRAFIEGDSNVCATKICGLWGRVWDGWKTAPYIRKISIMGDAGKVIKGLSDYDIINWCDWRITYNA